MARLSAPANVTPRAERKSSRFREIFKHRPSSSASLSPVTINKSPPPAESSPMPSLTMPPGFQQVGLLPNERSSDSLSRILKDEEGCDMEFQPIVAEAPKRSVNNESAMRNASDDLNIIDATPSYVEPTLPELKAENRVKKKGSFAQSMRRVLSQRPALNANEDITATQLAMSEGIVPTDVGGADKRSSVPLESSNKIAEPMYNKDKSSYTEGGMDGFNSFVEQSRNRDPAKNSDPAEDDSHKRKGMNFEKIILDDFVADLSMSRQILPSVETANGHEVDTARDGRSSHCKSFASNVFDVDSSLSQGICGYVTSKIAEALAEQERAHRSDVNAMAYPSVHIKIKVDGISLLRAEKHTRLSISDKKTDMFTQSNTIGPITITNAPLARHVQLFILVLYAVALLCASLLGPRTLLLIIWRMAVALCMYTVVLRQLRWTENVERDVFLAPISFSANVVKEIVMKVLD
ncbi:hypothetical protein AA0111_g12340 [Alternaria arborescens]|uniref:hypothetical protein n=1 Tax=Alternaria arborescens TaxID=156630 RepID=UPI001074B405|nr:hypothetical protein AA0111_g12340 [Alternaria arborescens]RYO13144.1 hypothetical protein AA0111_g12340 [Alternaria arborescens]